jgi:hypothetical protein
MKEVMNLRTNLFTFTTEDYIPESAMDDLMAIMGKSTLDTHTWAMNYKYGLIQRIFHKWCYDSTGTLTYLLSKVAEPAQSDQAQTRYEFELAAVRTLGWLVDTNS